MSSKQPSRKGKKAWRKNVDITAVTSGLEEVREQITQGGVIAEKADESLFALDLGGSDQIIKKEKLGRKLKADEILTTRSAVPAVSSKKRDSSLLGSGIYTAKKKRANGVSYAQLQRLRQSADSKSGVSAKSDAPATDLWDDAPVPVQRNEWIEEKVQPKPPVTLKHEPVSLSSEVKMPAVRVPHAGISYNPEFAKWDALLKEEGEKEVERERQRLADLAEEARIQALRDAEDPTPVEEDTEEEESDSESEVEDAEPKKPRDNKRKTIAQRNREARQKAQEKELAEKRKQKLMERELTLIKKYAKDVKAQERLRLAQKMEAMKKKADDETNPKIMRKKRFGKIPLPRAPLEVQLPEELAESLRTLKPEGNLLSDRFRSFRERGILETRAPIIEHKKKKVTSTEKWSYKDFV